MQITSGLVFSRKQMQNDFATLAISDLDSIDETFADLNRNSKAVDQHENRLAEIDFEQRFRSGELEDLFGLEQASVAALAQVEKPGLKCFCMRGKLFSGSELSRTQAGSLLRRSFRRSHWCRHFKRKEQIQFCSCCHCQSCAGNVIHCVFADLCAA